jgi:cell division control protein 6
MVYLSDLMIYAPSNNSSILPSVLILDELDHIGQDADSLSAVFSLAQTNPSILRIVGIANTHTLTAVMSEDISAGVKTLHFPAYTAQQLQDIVQLRLSILTDEGPETTAALKKLLPLPALTLLSKKIATQTGDVRAVFEVLRGAIDKAVVGSKLDETPAVTPAHVLAALKAYAPSSSSRSTTSHALPSLVGTVAPAPVAAAGSSEFVSKVQNLGIQARLALLAIILAFQRLEAGLALGNMPSTSSSTPLTPKSPVKRSASASVVENGGSHIDSAQLHAFYSTILTRDSSDVFTPVSRAEFVDLLGMLDTVGLVALVGSANACITPSKSGRRPFGRSSSFAAGAKGKGGAGARAQGVRLVDGARVDEILRGLGCAPTEAISTTDIAEEEVRALFTRERARITREVNARAVSSGFAEHFAEAIED